MGVVKHLMLFFLIILGGIGCATSTSLYSWGTYDSDMYQYYKNPDSRESLMLNLSTLIDSAEQNQTIPPGIYAEYGYLLLEAGNPSDALVYFEKEKSKWPESTIIMDKMIEVSGSAVSQQKN